MPNINVDINIIKKIDQTLDYIHDCEDKLEDVNIEFEEKKKEVQMLSSNLIEYRKILSSLVKELSSKCDEIEPVPNPHDLDRKSYFG